MEYSFSVHHSIEPARKVSVPSFCNCPRLCPYSYSSISFLIHTCHCFCHYAPVSFPLIFRSSLNLSVLAPPPPPPLSLFSLVCLCPYTYPYLSVLIPTRLSLSLYLPVSLCPYFYSCVSVLILLFLLVCLCPFSCVPTPSLYLLVAFCPYSYSSLSLFLLVYLFSNTYLSLSVLVPTRISLSLYLPVSACLYSYSSLSVLVPTRISLPTYLPVPLCPYTYPSLSVIKPTRLCQCPLRFSLSLSRSVHPCLCPYLSILVIYVYQHVGCIDSHHSMKTTKEAQRQVDRLMLDTCGRTYA